MKEASGELSMTAIAVVAIGAIAVIFTTFILPNIKATIIRNANCSQAYNCSKPNAKGLAKCSYLDKNNKPQPVSCQMNTN